MTLAPAKPISRHRSLRILNVLAIAWAFLFLVQFGPASGIVDWDMFHEMALAREIFASGHVPMRDSFAYTPTVFPVIHHEWGMGLLLYPVAVYGGLAGIYVLMLVLSAAIVSTCVVVARRCGASWPAIALAGLLIGPLGMLGYGMVRAQFLTLLFMALELLMLESDRRGRRAWMSLWPLLYVLWVNIHGGFLVGLGVLALYWLEEALRSRRSQYRLLAIFIASLALSGISPYGYAHIVSVVRGVLMPRPIVSEWGRLWTDLIRCTAFAVSLVPVIYLLISRGWRHLLGLPLLFVSGALAVLHLRHSGLYAVTWFCFVPAWFTASPAGRWFENFWERRAQILIYLVGMMVLASLITARVGRLGPTMPTRPNQLPGMNVIYPVGAVRYLQEQQFHGNVMTPFEMGSYLSWKLAPAVKVSIDSRFEVAYPPQSATESLDFYRARPGWRNLLARYPTDLVLVRNDAQVASQLGPDAGWNRVYMDDAYSLYARPGLGLPSEDRTGQPLLPLFP